VALVDLLKTYDIRPEAVTGHSSGEIAGAYACGAITLSETIIIAYYRGKVMLDVDPSVGGMAAIGLGPEQVRPYLLPGVLVGCENSPNSITITGNKDVLEAVIQNIKTENPEVLVKALQVDRAYHSRETTFPFPIAA
jgi:acyl transferase domain-containing protein